MIYLSILPLIIHAQANDKTLFQPEKPVASVYGENLLNINKLTAWYQHDGLQETRTDSKPTGFIFPRNTANAIYSSSILYAGNLIDGQTNTLIVNGQYYNSNFVSGIILGTRTGVREKEDASGVRMYRIRRDFATADLRDDAADYYEKPASSVSFGDINSLHEQYKKDWEEWPVQKGAPFYDSDNNGIYSPKFIIDKSGYEVPVLFPDADEPGIASADQVIWFVYNDLKATSYWGSPSVGLEFQTTLWAYNRNGGLDNAIFKKTTIIYKGTATTATDAQLKDMYIAQWSDIDIGRSTDDIAGCDSTLGLGYVYNQTSLDAEYQKFSLSPPAIGCDIVQGPIVEANANDSAIFGMRYRKGYKNISPTSFVYFGSGSGATPPSYGTNGATQWYNTLRGFFRDGPSRIDPVTNKSSVFWASGDPFTGAGWIDGTQSTYNERQILLSCGPFTMAVGDTQEFVSTVIAGIGENRLASVQAMKFYDKQIQFAYNNLFDMPPLPPAPKVSFVELDKGIILEWERDADAVAKTEQSNWQGYVFEGYNVYQLPSRSFPLSAEKRIATFDVKNEVTSIVQETLDETKGRLVEKIVQEGRNSGIVRYLYLTQVDRF